ncbi:MAG: hypothetical protein JXO72_14645 [Vicinamibacteria bacterium]|nr:hypothetical protein [Vicinamibacteria bacterium]
MTFFAGWALRERRQCRKLQAEHQRLVALAEANESRMADLQGRLQGLSAQLDALYKLAGINAGVRGKSSRR